VRDDKSPQVRRKTPPLAEPTICARCGAVYARRTWRHDHSLSDEQIERGEWGFCPACLQVAHQEGQGRLLIHGSAVGPRAKLIRDRIENVAKRAGKTQPERRLVSVAEVDGAGRLEVLTTSQKLAHRLAHELKKAFGGKVAYSWSDDGSLFAQWDYDIVSGRLSRRKG
jgi:NMD protein affecting ribosome stability and mRNA decay